MNPRHTLLALLPTAQKDVGNCIGNARPEVLGGVRLARFIILYDGPPVASSEHVRSTFDCFGPFFSLESRFSDS